MLVDGADSTSDASGCGDSANPCNTIQKGIDVATAPDVVQVAAGTYAGAVSVGKAVTVQGSGAPVITAPVTMTAPGAALQGFTLQGAGPLVTATATVTLSGDTFKWTSGTGVLITSGTPEIHLSRFSGSGVAVAGSANAEHNFWGCNEAPGTAGCPATTGAVDADPWLRLTWIHLIGGLPVNTHTTVPVEFNDDSDGAQVDATAFPPTTVAFTIDFGEIAPTAISDAGVARADYFSAEKGSASGTARVDGAGVNFHFEVDDFFTTGGETTSTTVPPDNPPAVSFRAPVGGTIPAARTRIQLDVADDHEQPLASIYDRDKLLCTVGPPYACDWTPNEGDVIGGAMLRAVVLDSRHQEARATRTLKVTRFAPLSVHAKPKPSRDKRAPYRFTVIGAVARPVYLNPVVTCHGGKLRLAIKGGGVQSDRTVRLADDCTFKAPITVKRKGSVAVRTTFLGSRVLAPARAKPITLHAG